MQSDKNKKRDVLLMVGKLNCRPIEMAQLSEKLCNQQYVQRLLKRQLFLAKTSSIDVPVAAVADSK